jgi:hypothetical protein
MMAKGVIKETTSVEAIELVLNVLIKIIES